jgi:hypothetical protein
MSAPGSRSRCQVKMPWWPTRRRERGRGNGRLPRRRNWSIPATRTTEPGGPALRSAESVVRLVVREPDPNEDAVERRLRSHR